MAFLALIGAQYRSRKGGLLVKQLGGPSRDNWLPRQRSLGLTAPRSTHLCFKKAHLTAMVSSKDTHIECLEQVWGISAHF